MLLIADAFSQILIKKVIHGVLETVEEISLQGQMVQDKKITTLPNQQNSFRSKDNLWADGGCCDSK